VIGFVGDNFSRTRFRGCRAEEGDRALRWSPGQARAHTGEVGVGVGQARPGTTSCGWLHCSAGPCPLSWAVRA
jgi:hypothetical protein